MQDAELVKLAQKDDEQAFCALIQKYEKRIYNIAYKFMRNEHDAQDAAQDAIIKMYTNKQVFLPVGLHHVDVPCHREYVPRFVAQEKPFR
jgi:DNA-directed RNA polymerase specialized sigma24 family protein